MEYRFSNIFLEKKDLLSQKKYEIDPFLLENNTSQIEKIFEFYADEKNQILFVNGFLGTGKADIVKYSTAFLNDEVIVLKYNCFNSTVLDDILLSFFKEFRQLAQDNVINPPKIKTDNFNERINSYFSTVEKPFLIILDSFEAILNDNRQEILDFIFHLVSMGKTKIVVIGRSYDEKYFEEKNITRITTRAFEKKLFEKFLKSEKIKAPSKIIDDFYTHTRGYYYYTSLTAKILSANDISLEEFLNKLKEKFIPFNKLLEQELLSIIPPAVTHLFWFLILIRQDVSIDLLKKIEMYDKENIDKLIDDKIIVKEGENLYIQDYFDEITKFAPQNLLLRLRQYLVDIYQSQLPLKPFERDICISRQTMRKEIEYHKLFLPKKAISLDNQTTDINFLSYSKVFNSQNTQLQQPVYERNTPERPATQPTKMAGIDLSQRKNVSLNLGNFSTSNTKESNAQISNSQQKTFDKKTVNTEIIKEKSFNELISLIKKAEKLFQYSEVLELSQEALTMKKDTQYKELLPFIYAKIANAYTKTAQHDKALGYYGLLEQTYRNDDEKLSQIKMKIANIYYETYKFEQAKNIYTEITQNAKASENIILNSYLKLINIAEEQNAPQKDVLTYFKKAMDISKNVNNENALTELYFKFALVLDDENNIKGAKEYYNKCIEINDTISNKFLSSSYSNLAALSMEDNNIGLAIQYYKQAFEVDTTTQNNEGAYDSATKLGDILKKQNNSSDAIEFYKKALDSAKLTNDVFYIISSALVIGDYYYEIKKDEIALKYYIYAYNFAQNKTNKQNIERIKIRLNDIKIRLGEQKYNNLIEMLEIQSEENE